MSDISLSVAQIPFCCVCKKPATKQVKGMFGIISDICDSPICYQRAKRDIKQVEDCIIADRSDNKKRA